MTDTLVPVAQLSAEEWDERVLAFREALLAGRQPSPADAADASDRLEMLEEIARMIPAASGGLLGEQIDRGGHTEHGCSSPVSYLQQLLRLSRSEASARVRAVERFQPRTQLSGEVLPPRFPTVAAAMRAGEISDDHGKIIATSLERLPATVSAQARETAEEHLVDSARHWGPAAVSRRATYLEQVLDPDGLLTTETERVRGRSSHCTRPPMGCIG